MPKEFVVSPAPVRGALKKVARKLKKLRKTARGSKLKAIDLELKLLKDCFIKLGNVKWI